MAIGQHNNTLYDTFGRNEGGDFMDIIGWILLLAIASWLYRFGKRTGSRKGFHAGRTRGRRR